MWKPSYRGISPGSASGSVGAGHPVVALFGVRAVRNPDDRRGLVGSGRCKDM